MLAPRTETSLGSGSHAPAELGRPGIGAAGVHMIGVLELAGDVRSS